LGEKPVSVTVTTNLAGSEMMPSASSGVQVPSSFRASELEQARHGAEAASRSKTWRTSEMSVESGIGRPRK
jgi:hypothetical protein